MKKIYLSIFAALALMLGGAVMNGAVYAADAKPAANAKAPAKNAFGETPWTVRCNKNEKDQGPKRGRCEIAKIMIHIDSKKRFIEAAIGFPKEKTDARGIFVVPLGILLQPGLQMKIDDGKAFKFQARYCDANGCFGYVDLNKSLLDMMRKGTMLTLSFVATNGKTINVELSLKDFGKALDQVS